MITLFKLIFFSFLFIDLNDCTYIPKLASILQVQKPGFATFIPSTVNNTYHLAISSFDGAPFSQDYMFYLANYTLNSSSSSFVRLDNKNLLWPNENSFIDISILNEKADPYGGIIVPFGFLVPSKENGGIMYYPFTSKDRSNVTNGAGYEITLTSQGKVKWFYHRVKLFDVSGDGKLDLLTCRSYKPIVGQTQVQLVAFVQDPQSGVFSEKIILNDACDIFFDVADIDGDGKFEIIAAGFFIEKLNLIYSDDPNNSFLNGNVKVQTIDSNGGKLFDVRVADLDMDGDFEILVTNHQGNKDSIKGSIYYYDLQGNVRTGKWSRFTVYSNFPVLKSGINQAAPGDAKAFFPNLKDRNARPYLLVSGDGAEQAYLFEPSDSNPVTYKLVWSQLYKGYTIGGTSIADINGDGFNEFIITVYESNTCDVYTFR